MDDLTLRLAEIQDQISAAAARSGRRADGIRLIAVTKTHPAETVRAALQAGVLDLGENKVQEARGKIEEIGRGTWHLIGHLQSNKAREAVRIFDWIDSLDSLALAEELNHHAELPGKTQNVLLQVNVARESAKFGCAPEAASALVEKINALPRLALHGLMTIAPYATEPEKARPHFAALRELRDRLQTDTGLALPILSMGMSGDFGVAIEEGATSVRIGSAIFGARPRARALAQALDPSFLEST